MNQAEYEAIKAQVLEDQKAERRVRAKERARIMKEASCMFDQTIDEYLPKMVARYAKKTGNFDCAYQCMRKIDEAILSVLGILRERNRITAYQNGKAEEANAELKKLLANIIED